MIHGFTTTDEYLRNNHKNAHIVLNFSTKVKMTITVDGKEANSKDTTSSEDDSDAVKEFMDYMDKTPEERYFDLFLKQEGLTQEQFEALSPEERAKIEETIQQKIRDKVKEEVAKKNDITLNAQGNSASL